MLLERLQMPISTLFAKPGVISTDRNRRPGPRRTGSWRIPGEPNEEEKSCGTPSKAVAERFSSCAQARDVSMNSLQGLENQRRFHEAVEPCLQDG